MVDVVFEKAWDDLQRQINALNTRVTEITQKSVRSETAGGMQSFAYDDRPLAATGGMQTDNTAYVDIIFIYNARKSGEGAGAGTGQPCYYDPAIDDYRVFRDDSVVTA